jgi:hypothetical protein
MGTFRETHPDPLDTATPSFHPGIEALTDSFDDMIDSDKVIAAFSLLPLASCQPITAAFRVADNAAIFYRNWHRRLTLLAATVGTAAVVLAIIELAYSQLMQDVLVKINLPPLSLAWVELTCVLIAFIVAGVGVASAFKEKWLLARHQAEQFRLLKYSVLIHPAVWRNLEWIDAQVKTLQELDVRKAPHRAIKEALKKATREPVPYGPFELPEHLLPRQELRALVEYYLARRLSPQKEYLANRVQKNEKGDWIAFVVFWLFVGSGGAVLARSALTLTVRGGENSWATFLTVLAALLPACAAGVRLVRGSAEFSRNKARFEAAHRALAELEECLVHDGISALMAPAAKTESLAQTREFMRSTPRPAAVSFSQLSDQAERQRASQAVADSSTEPPADAHAVVRDLWWCEHILKSEQLEWLRLMYETEWFG